MLIDAGRSTPLTGTARLPTRLPDRPQPGRLIVRPSLTIRPRVVGLAGDQMGRRTFNAGETIFQAGDQSDCAFLIVVGTVEARLPNGRHKRLGPGEIFGEMGLIDSRPRSATIVAVDYTVCATYSETELLQAIRTHPNEAVALHPCLDRTAARRQRRPLACVRG